MSKAVTLYAYTIENSDASRAYSDFTEKFRAKLSDSKTIRQRMLEINSQTHETDVLSQVVSYNNGYIYGTLMRIILSKEMPSLPSDYLDKNELSFSELDGVGADNDKMSCKDLYYFALDDRHLITTMPTSKISRFRTFVNHFLETELIGKSYVFSVMITTPKNIRLQDLRKIEFAGDSRTIQNEDNIINTSILQIAFDGIKRFILDEDIKPLLDKNILTANLVVKFNERSKKKLNEEDVKRAMSAIVTNLTDNENVKFSTKNNIRIKAGETILSKHINVETVENNLLNEADLRQEMLDFLSEINNQIR